MLTRSLGTKCDSDELLRRGPSTLQPGDAPNGANPLRTDTASSELVEHMAFRGTSAFFPPPASSLTSPLSSPRASRPRLQHGERREHARRDYAARLHRSQRRL